MAANNIVLIAKSFLSAALGVASWEAAMDSAGESTGSVGALLLPLKGVSLPGVPFSQSIGSLVESYFTDGWSTRDERRRGLPKMFRTGVMTDLDFATQEEIGHSSFYQDFHGRFGLRWFAGIKIDAGDDVWCLAIQRSIKQGPFSMAQVRRLAAIAPRLSSAAAIASALSFAKVDTALAAFEVSATGVIFIDRGGNVSGLNSVARGLLGPHLKIEGRRLASWSREATATLDRALHVLAWNREGPTSEVPVVLPRITGRPIVAYPSRLPGVTDDFLSPARMILVLHDLDKKRLAPEEALRSIFKLTKSEARLAARVGSGKAVEATADELGISYETARSMLKTIMQKTDTHRQAELVSLFARIVAAPAVLSS